MVWLRERSNCGAVFRWLIILPTQQKRESRSEWLTGFHLCVDRLWSAGIQTGRSLSAFNDAEITFRAGAESLKGLLVTIAFMSCECDIEAVEFDNHSPQC